MGRRGRRSIGSPGGVCAPRSLTRTRMAGSAVTRWRVSPVGPRWRRCPDCLTGLGSQGDLGQHHPHVSGPTHTACSHLVRSPGHPPAPRKPHGRQGHRDGRFAPPVRSTALPPWSWSHATSGCCGSVSGGRARTCGPSTRSWAPTHAGDAGCGQGHELHLRGGRPRAVPARGYRCPNTGGT